MANWLNSTIRRKDRRLSVIKPDTKSPEADGTKSSATAHNGSQE